MFPGSRVDYGSRNSVGMGKQDLTTRERLKLCYRCLDFIFIRFKSFCMISSVEIMGGSREEQNDTPILTLHSETQAVPYCLQMLVLITHAGVGGSRPNKGRRGRGREGKVSSLSIVKCNMCFF